MGKRVRSSLQALVYRDGILFLILAVVPTTLAVALFYAGNTAPAQSATMTLSATLHSLLAARAYRNLSDLCERLPISMRYTVSNGTRLDADTLGRIAFIMGNPNDARLEQGGRADMTSPAYSFEAKEEINSLPLSAQSSRGDSTSCNSIHIVTHQQVLRAPDDVQGR